MGLNTIGITFLIGLLAVFGLQATKQEQIHSIPELPGLLVPQSTGKERVIVSKHGDASMHTERMRRSAIMANHSCGSGYNKPIHESNITSGFTNGVVEAYMLSAICNNKVYVPPFVGPPPVNCATQVYEGGHPFDDYQNILDGGYPGMDDPAFDTYYDGGGPGTTTVNVFDGLDPLSNVMDILYSRLNAIQKLDGGNPNTNLC
jgi:hypothetical protein